MHSVIPSQKKISVKREGTENGTPVYSIKAKQTGSLRTLGDGYELNFPSLLSVIQEEKIILKVLISFLIHLQARIYKQYLLLSISPK